MKPPDPASPTPDTVQSEPVTAERKRVRVVCGHNLAPAVEDPVVTVDFAPAGAPATRAGFTDATVNEAVVQADPLATVAPEAGKLATGHAPDAVAGYEILGLLGRGGMGVVYKARQVGLNRVVALKMILSGDHADDRERARFRSEAEAVARIQHPNIVQIYEIGEEEGRPYFSLEYVDGGSLTGKINGEPQPPREAARLVHVLAGAMDCAHRAGVIHRDLKPANVLLTADGAPKITDFGLAKRVQENTGQTQSGSILGTPGYMAPEQAEGRNDEVGAPADVYALGAILYELLTGRMPFRAPSVLETLEQVRTREPVAPVELQPTIPRDLETICLKCLQKDPRRRYDGAGALTEDLRRFLGQEPILARRVGRIERGWRWCRRNPRLAILSAATAAIVVAWAVSMSALAWGLKLQKEETDRNAAAASANAIRANDNAATAKAAQADADQNAAEAKALAIKASNNAAAAKAAGAIADQNAAEAKANAIKAYNNAAVARANADKAYNTAKVAVARMTETAGSVQDALDAALFAPDQAPQLRDLRNRVVNRLRDEMLGMAKDIEATKATPFAQTAMYQQVGDRLKHLGKGEEALEQFRLGREIAERTAAEKPNDDKSRANLGVMLKRLGDMELELHGDAQAAHDYYEKGRALQQDVADHPHSGDYTELQNTTLLSHYEISLGKADRSRGDDAAARDHFDRALSLRRKWCAARPASGEARTYLVEGLMERGTTAALLADAKVVQESFDEAVPAGRELVKATPQFLSQADLGELFGAWGDAQLRLGKPEEAEKAYRESLENLKAFLDQHADHMDYQALLARTEERLATVAALKGDRDGAAKAYREALRLRLQLLDIEPNNLSWQAACLPTLAHCGREADAMNRAADLCGKHPKSVPLLLDAARCYSACAATAADDASKQRDVERAVAALRAATEAGYKDVGAWKTDADLAAIREEAGYKSLVEELAKR